MREILRTSDIVVLSCARAVLEAADIAFVVLDEYVGAALGLAPRVMVEPRHYLSAVGALRNAGLGSYLRDV